jgi:hypothetical protein
MGIINEVIQLHARIGGDAKRTAIGEANTKLTIRSGLNHIAAINQITHLRLLAAIRGQIGRDENRSGMLNPNRPLCGEHFTDRTVIAGKLASGGRLIIETPLGQIQNRAPGAGIGSLAFGILTFNLINELKAATLDPSPTSDSTIDLNLLLHGAFIIRLNNGQVLVADDVTKTYWVHGGSAEVLTNTPLQMASYRQDFLGADAVHQAILNDVLYQQTQHAFNQPNAGATGGGDNPSTLGLNGNGSGQGPTFIIPVIATGGNTISNSGSSTGTPLVIIPPPSLPSNLVIWTSPATTGHPSDLFVVGANWNTGSTPSTSQTAEILALPNGATPLIVQLAASGNVGGLIIGAGVILQITNGATLTVANGIQNSGMIEFLDPPILSPNGSMFLNGGGIVAMPGPTPASADNTLNQIIAAKPGSALVNVNNTIIGGNATIGKGDGALTLVNQAGGTIEATSVIPAMPSSDGVIVFNTGNTITGIINAGLMEATVGGTLDVKDGEINNSGTGNLGIAIDGTSKLLVDVGSLKLDGTGQVALSGGTISGQVGTNELENFDNTIVGTGTISNLDLDNDAAGIINATGGMLILQTGTTIDNAGLMEATTGGTLHVEDDITNNGVVTALGGGTVELVNNTVTGGQMTVQSGGEIVILPSATLDGVTVTDSSTGISGSGGIEVSGGKLTLNGGTDIVGSGTGTLAIDAGSQVAVTTGGAIFDGLLVDDDTTSGSPGIDVSGGVLTLKDGTQIQGGSTGASAGTLTIESAAGSQLLVSTGGAGLDGMSVTDANTSKGIDISGGVLTLSDGTVISGGTMTVESTASSALVITAGSGADAATASGATLTGVAVTDSSTGISGSGGIEVSGGKLTLNGGTDIVGSGTGTLVIDSGSQLLINGAATLDGLIVDDDTTASGTSVGIGVTSGSTLTLDDATQIWGGGSGTLTIESGGVLSIATASGATLDGLSVTDNNTTANGIDVLSLLTLTDGTVISGGTMTIESNGEIQITAGTGVDGATPGGATIQGVSVTDIGTSNLTVTSGR